MEAPASPTPDTMRPEVAVRHVVWSILMEKDFGIEGHRLFCIFLLGSGTD